MLRLVESKKALLVIDEDTGAGFTIFAYLLVIVIVIVIVVHIIATAAGVSVEAHLADQGYLLWRGVLTLKLHVGLSGKLAFEVFVILCNL